jgi:hypothetical protein
MQNPRDSDAASKTPSAAEATATTVRSQKQADAAVLRHIWRYWQIATEYMSGEWLLTRCKLANGGSVILMRALLTGATIYAIALVLRNVLDETRTWHFSLSEIRSQIKDTLSWFGAAFAGVYAALYTRFASQWSYLANVYNQIKAAECRESCNADRLAEWKTGFIDDAIELHLAGKPSIASIIYAWGGTAAVKKQFQAWPGGTERLESVMGRVTQVIESRES